jgi:opacity protein-like surface antigen
MKRILALAILAALASSPAMAADRGFYAGFDLGQYAYDLDQGDIDASLVAALDDEGYEVLDGSSSTNEDGFTYGLIVGYQIFRYLAVEAAYVDLGDSNYQANVVVTDGVESGDLNAKLTAESSGALVSALGILPLPYGWDVFGRAGLYLGSTDLSERWTGATGSRSYGDSATSQDFTWGAGVGFTQGDWTARLEYQQFMDVGDEDKTGEFDVGRIVFSAVHRF